MRNSTSIVHQCGNQFDCLLAYRNVGEGLACQARCRNPRHRDVQRQGHRFHRPTHQSKKPQSRCHCRVGACRLRLGPKTVRFIGGNGFNSPKLAEIAGEAADGTLVGSPWFLTKKDDVNQKFVEAYKGKYGEDPDQFAAQAFVTLNCPLTPETKHLVDARRLSLVKSTAFLINCARGPVVDQRALTKALQERRIAGAGLDVFDPEPPHPDDPLLKLDNIIVTPHALCWTDQMFEGIGATDVKAVRS